MTPIPSIGKMEIVIEFHPEERILTKTFLEMVKEKLIFVPASNQKERAMSMTIREALSVHEKTIHRMEFAEESAAGYREELQNASNVIYRMEQEISSLQGRPTITPLNKFERELFESYGERILDFMAQNNTLRASLKVLEKKHTAQETENNVLKVRLKNCGYWARQAQGGLEPSYGMYNLVNIVNEARETE